MPRRSYREHRARRASQQQVRDDDSIASYSTLGSYTAYTGSVAGSYIAGSAATGTGSGHRPRTSSTARELADLELRSRLSPPPARSASPHTRHFPPRLDGSAILRSRSPGLGESALSPRLSPAISGLSSVSELPGKDQIPFPGLPEHHSSNFSLGSSSDSMRERATSTASALLDGKPLPDEHVNGTAIATEKEKKLEKRRLEDEKRRKRARNEEKWRKVRAREAAHDAPIRRWARFVQNRVGTKGAVLLALLGCWAVRILLAWASLSLSRPLRSTLARQADNARMGCTLVFPLPPWARPFAPLCRVALKYPTQALSLAHLSGESVLWSGFLAWAVIEGWREGRTLRTRVSAIVYLILSPALVLSSLLLQARTVPLGVVAWALLAASSGWDAASAALLTVAISTDSRMWAYVPSFVTYAVGKWVWLGRRGKGYIPRLAVAVGFATTLLSSASSAPLRVQVAHVTQVLASLLTKDGLHAVAEKLSSIFQLYTLWIIAALAPSAYLLLRASYVLRPSPGEPATHDSIPATVRLLPIALTATTAAIAISLPATSRVADTALPLLPLALASSLRGDDDEWAVAVQAAQVANIAMWPALAKYGLLPLTVWAIGWSYVVGAKRDAPDPILRVHQMITTFLTTLAPFMPLLAPFVPSTTMGYLKYAQEGFIVASLGLLILWANVRLLKSAWAIGAL